MLPKKLSKISNGVKKKPKFFLTVFLSLFLFFSFTPVTNATEVGEVACGTEGQTIKTGGWLEDIGIEKGLIIPIDCLCKADVKTCGLSQMIQTGINISTLIVGLTGSVALLMFAYGGVMFIIAAGNQERVTKAKQILGAAGIGIVIIFTSWLLVNFIILTVTKGEIGNRATIFGQDWASK